MFQHRDRGVRWIVRELGARLDTLLQHVLARLHAQHCNRYTNCAGDLAQSSALPALQERCINDDRIAG